MNDQQQETPDTQINIKVDAVEPVVERIARALESIAASLETLGQNLGTIEGKCVGVELVGGDNFSAEDFPEYAEHAKPSKLAPIKMMR